MEKTSKMFQLLLRAVSAQHPRRKGAHVKYSDLIEISGFNINGRIQPRYHVTILIVLSNQKPRRESQKTPVFHLPSTVRENTFGPQRITIESLKSVQLLLRAVSAQHPRRKGAHVKYSDLIEISGFNINGRIQPHYHVTILDCVIQSKAKKRKPENSRLPLTQHRTRKHIWATKDHDRKSQVSSIIAARGERAAP